MNIITILWVIPQTLFFPSAFALFRCAHLNRKPNHVPLIYDVFSSLDIIMEPLQNGCGNKNVTEHKAATYRRAADTDYANECSAQPHYEPWREVVFLDDFPDEV